MSWMLGAGMGFLRGGPMGAVIGGALQHVVTKKLRHKIQKSLPGLDDQGIFVTSVAVIMTKIAMTHGSLKPNARVTIKKFFQKNLNYSEVELGFVDKVIDETQSLNPDLEPIVNQYCKACRNHYTALLLALGYHVALVQGGLSDVVQEELNRLSGFLKLSYEKHDLIRNKYRLEALKTPFTILEIPFEATNEEIKKAYRQMVKQYHPDKMAHLGEEQAQEAHLKFLEIIEAYQELERVRGV